MPNLFPGVDTWAANIRTVADGEAVSAAITDLSGSDAADRTLWLRNRINGLPGAGSTMTIPLIGWSTFDAVTAAPVWAFDGNTNWAQQSDNTFVNVTGFPLPRLRGCQLNNVQLQVCGAGGHGALPGAMPVCSLSYKSTIAAPTIIATTTDPSAAVPAYQADHVIALVPGAPELMTRDLYVFCNGEGGANFVAGFYIWRILLTLSAI